MDLFTLGREARRQARGKYGGDPPRGRNLRNSRWDSALGVILAVGGHLGARAPTGAPLPLRDYVCALPSGALEFTRIQAMFVQQATEVASLFSSTSCCATHITAAILHQPGQIVELERRNRIAFGFAEGS